MLELQSTFVGVVGGIAMSFGGLWIWFQYGASPRELAERRKAKLKKKDEAKRKANRCRWLAEQLTEES